jgi:pimeloyl-ACP methyl ester carboxylesterase
MEDPYAHEPRAYAVTLLAVRRLVVIATLLVALVGTVDAGLPRTARAAVDDRPASLAWHACGEAFECADLGVPLSYRSPDGGTIDLAVIRRRAEGPQRIGSLVLNPGGPGASALSYLRAIADLLPRHVRERFDLVSFDPRGIGESSPVVCDGNIDPVLDASFSPRNARERAELVAAFRTLVDSCSRASGSVLPHVATVDTARDLDRLRAAMGDETLSFVGQSYGTYLGTLYASMFPDRVRTIVLDGAIDPGASGAAIALGQARGFERALDDFLEECAARRDCPFRHDGRTGAAYDALRARAVREPLATLRNAGRTVNGTRFDAGVLGALYAGRAGWKALAQALADAEDGNAATLLGYADAFVYRESAGTRHQALDAFWAITCLDGPLVGDVAAAARLEARARRAAPRLGAFLVNFTLPCSMWPVPPVESPGRLTAAGAPPILVIGTTGDPATPLASATVLARSLDRAALLVATGEQHTSFLVGNGCVDRAVTRYLVERRLPRRGARC